MKRVDDELDALFQAYHESVAVPESGPYFMPRLWERIEARRNFMFRFKKLSQVFVGLAAALCLLMTGVTVMWTPSPQQHASYVDVLAEAHPAENVAALGILGHPDSEASH